MPILALLARIRMPSCKASSKAKGISTLRFANHHAGPNFRTYAALPIAPRPFRFHEDKAAD
jgi:hypothetical protein